jgi:hypothetical protein
MVSLFLKVGVAAVVLTRLGLILAQRRRLRVPPR